MAHDPRTHRRILSFTETLDLPVRDLTACDVIAEELAAIAEETRQAEDEDGEAEPG